MIGRRLSHYDILEQIGAGGMGQVYRARDTRLGRTVAIKVLAPALAADPQFRDRFEREARTLSRIEHPHICALYDVGVDDGTAYLVMQHLEGETLTGRIARGPVPVQEALRITIELCDALATAHRHGIVHRDLKPGNVILTKTGARLLDFGLARQAVLDGFGGETALAPQIPNALATGEGTILGTLHYMAPEQVRGRTADARSDIFSLGIVLFELLTGRRPFEASDSASLIAHILERPLPPLDGVAGVPPRLVAAVQTAVEKDPDDRWQTCRDFARELTSILQEMSTPNLSRTTPAEVTGRRSLGSMGWMSAAVLAAILLGGYATTRWWAAGSGNATQVIVLMDSAHPQRVYDPATLKSGGTNADDLTDQLGDLGASLVKETTGPSWHREDQILAQNPDLVLVHRSAFYDATLLPDLKLNDTYFEHLYPAAADKLEVFLGYVALANPRTRFVVYSRKSWASDAEKTAWIASVERRFPRLTGRLFAYSVPLDRPTFRHPDTAAEMKAIVRGLLGPM